MKMRLLAVGASLFLGFPAAELSAQGVKAPSSADCSNLAGFRIPRQSIGLPTSGAAIGEAKTSDAAGDPTGLCIVKGVIAPINPGSPSINFQINLPRDWNRKSVQMGGGGYDGIVATTRNHPFLPADKDPVRIGYVSFGSDSGHAGRSGSHLAAVTDASFGMDAEARENFAYAQIKKTHDTAIAVIERYYGAKPKRTYFYGNSQGGHEALLAAQRFGADYDGVVAIHPAYNMVALQLRGLAVSKSVYRNPDAWLSPAKVSAIGAAALGTCDKLDGITDGVIANLAQCRREFRIERLACKAGQSEQVGCLSEPQLQAAREIAAPTQFGISVSGASSFGGWPIFEGAFSHPSPFALGNSARPNSPPGLNDAFVYLMADEGIRYLIAQDLALETLEFEPTQHEAMIKRASDLIDVSTPDFDRFKARGGKILLMHGSIDMAIPPANSIALFGRLQERYGSSLDQFVKFYMAYGFGHGDGTFQIEWDSLGELDRWVETGNAPGPQVVRDRSEGHAGRTMPLCEFPEWPRYMGQGDKNSAVSFKCVRQ